MTKRAMEQEAAEMLADEKSRCGCTYDWNDHFEVLCDEHQREADEEMREYHWSIIARD